MDLSKQLSLMVAGITAALLALILLAAPEQGWNQTLSGPFAMPVLILGVAGCVGVVYWLIAAATIDSELEQLRQHVETIGAKDASESSYIPQTWLRKLYQSIDRSVGQTQQRNDQLHSKRRELEIQVRIADAERQHAEGILHSIRDPVLVTDAFNEIALANEAAARIFHFDLNNCRHQPIDRLMGDPTMVKLIKDTRESGNVHNQRHVEHTIGASEGRPTVYDISLACVSNAQGEVTGVVTILRDVTREREVSEMKSNFVSGVSHELRTPLSSIKAYVEMLVDGEADDEETRREFYNIIQSEANRLSRLIDNILNISRIESGIQRVQREDVHLSKLMREAVEVLQPQARAKNITLREMPSPLHHTIYADKDMVYQAILNLVGNAIKYTPEGGRVTVDTQVEDIHHQVTINVTDTGVGVPPDALPHLFEKFYRVNDHKKIAKGTGLGLNLVKHIVETVHHGRVSVTSQVGKGSTFSMCLPISEAAAAAAPKPPTQSATKQGAYA